jgi:hypothetical protein
MDAHPVSVNQRGGFGNGDIDRLVLMGSVVMN